MKCLEEKQKADILVTDGSVRRSVISTSGYLKAVRPSALDVKCAKETNIRLRGKQVSKYRILV